MSATVRRGETPRGKQWGCRAKTACRQAFGPHWFFTEESVVKCPKEKRAKHKKRAGWVLKVAQEFINSCHKSSRSVRRQRPTTPRPARLHRAAPFGQPLPPKLNRRGICPPGVCRTKQLSRTADVIVRQHPTDRGPEGAAERGCGRTRSPPPAADPVSHRGRACSTSFVWASR